MKPVKVTTLAAAVSMVAAVFAPPAHAMMGLGNYNVLTDRYNQASWVWFVARCQPVALDCVDVSAAPRLKFYAYYDGYAHLTDSQYTLTVDVPDGLRCPGYNMPTRDTYSWDQVTLAGTINSDYDVGCFNGPPGSQFWTFSLQRL